MRNCSKGMRAKGLGAGSPRCRNFPPLPRLQGFEGYLNSKDILRKKTRTFKPEDRLFSLSSKSSPPVRARGVCPRCALAVPSPLCGDKASWTRAARPLCTVTGRLDVSLVALGGWRRLYRK